jgi:hydrogenase maturation protease
MQTECETLPETSSRAELAALGRPAMIIGLGNDFRGDDGAGRLVARRVLELLGPEARRDDDVVVLENEGDAAELLASWSGYQTVVLVDAVSSGAEPGSVMRFDADSLPLEGSIRFASTHALGFAGAVGLARAIGILPKRFEVQGIEGARFEAGAPMSPEVEAAVEIVAREIVRRLQS